MRADKKKREAEGNEFLLAEAERRRAETLGRVSARQGRNSCSKKVQASFSNCDQVALTKIKK